MAARRDPKRLDNAAKSALDQRLGTYERRMISNYAEAVDAIRTDIGRIYERYSTDGTLSLADMTRFNRLQKLEKQLTEDIRPVMLKNERLIERMKTVEYDEAFYRFAWTIDQQSGVALQWGLLRQADVLASVSNPLTKIAASRLKQDGIAKIRRAVTQGLIRGQSYPQMMRGIRSAINGNRADAMRIVRTEGQRAQVLGQQATYERADELGVEGRQIWDATLDGRTRESHGALDGVPARDESPKWTINGYPTDGPTQSGVASEDINCRCRVTYEIEGYEPKLRRIRGEGVVEYTTYDDWKAGLNARGRSV